MANRVGAEQLPLAIDAPAATAIPERIQPMTPLPGGAPFDDPDWFFEPWWPGTAAMAYVDAGSVRLRTGHMADPLAALPELVTVARQVRGHRAILEGMLLVLDAEGRPDEELLRRRLADPAERAGVPAFVASDLLHRGDRPLLAVAFEERRALLTRELEDSDTCVVSRGLRGEGMTMAEAVASMGLADISARLLTARYRPGQQDETWLRVPVVEQPVTPRRPLLAVLQRLPLDA